MSHKRPFVRQFFGTLRQSHRRANDTSRRPPALSNRHSGNDLVRCQHAKTIGTQTKNLFYPFAICCVRLDDVSGRMGSSRGFLLRLRTGGSRLAERLSISAAFVRDGRQRRATMPARRGEKVTPNITSLNPTSVPVGAAVTITGTNFGSTRAPAP
jgi:hypothetical protein